MEKINQTQVLPSGLLGTISREIGWGQTVKKVKWGGGGGSALHAMFLCLVTRSPVFFLSLFDFLD